MTGEKVKIVTDIYEKKLKGLLSTERWEENKQLEHLVEMCVKIRGFVGEDRMDKAFRWLGFVQGALWSNGVYTIEEMKNHNRPVKKDFPGHSLAREQPCSACGDMDGCHHWLKFTNEN